MAVCAWRSCGLCSLPLRYNKAAHKAQGVVESALGSTTIKKGRGKVAAVDEDALPPASDAESEPEGDDDEIDISKFQKKPRGGGRAAAAPSGDAKPKRKTGGAAGKTKAAPAKKRKA